MPVVRNLMIRAGADFSGMRKETLKAQKTLKNFSTSVSTSMFNVRNALKVALGYVSIRSMYSFGKAATDVASDLTEVQNVVDVTFGSMAKDVDNFANTAIEQFGLSVLSAKKYTSSLGAMMKSSGITGAAVRDMAIDLTKLAADMASFYNLEHDEAFNKIMSGMAGTVRPLRDLGINMSVANLEAYALSRGIKKSYQAMSQAEKTMLRYEYLLSVTGDAQGDFARTSRTWANQTKILTQQFVSLKGEIGQGLINVLMPALKAMNVFIKRIQVAAATFRSFTATIFGEAQASSQGGAVMSDMAESLDDVGDAYDDAAAKAKGSVAGFDEVNQLVTPDDAGALDIGPMTAMVPDMTAAEEKAEETANIFKAKLAEIKDAFDFSGIQNALAALKEALAPFRENVGTGLKWFWDNVLLPISTWVINEAVPAFLGLIASALDALNPILEALKPLGEWLWNNFLQPIAAWTGQAFVDAINLTSDALKSIGDWMSNNKSVIEGVVIALAAFFAAWKITQLMAFIQMAGGVTGAINLMTAAVWNNVFAKLADKAETIAIIALYAKDFAVSLAKGIASLATSTAAWIANTAAKGANTVAAWAAVAGQAALTAATTAWNVICGVATAVTTALGAAFNFLASPITLIILAIAAVIAIVVLLIKHWDDVKAAAITCWEWIKDTWSVVAEWFNTNIIQPVAEFFSGLWEGIKEVWREASDWFDTHVIQPLVEIFEGFQLIITGIWDSIWDAIKSVINFIIDGVNLLIRGLNKLHFELPDWIPGIGGMGFGINIPEIPKLARGGLIDSPTIAMLGEAGTEAVVPLENTGFINALASAIGTAVLNAMQFAQDDSDDGRPLVLQIDSSRIARVLLPSLRNELRRSGHDLVLREV